MTGTDTSSIDVRAYPGVRGTFGATSTAYNGGAGTIYYKHPGQPAYDLRIGGLNNYVICGASTPVPGVTVDTFTATYSDVWFVPGSVFTASSATIYSSSMTVSTFAVSGTGIRLSSGSVLMMTNTTQMVVN